MSRVIEIGGREVGDNRPVFVVAEIGINHNGDLELARKLLDSAAFAGCDAVKFQKREPEVCVPAAEREVMRDTPWGRMTYLEYRKRVEFGEREYAEIARCCRERGLLWFASCWDEPSVDFIERFDPCCHKIASACLTDAGLLRRVAAAGRPVILSTGMSNLEQIKAAVKFFDPDKLIVAHTTSAYPCPPADLNLRMISTLREMFPGPVGYSGHEVGLPTTVAAVALGACFVERHITLDRAMWGSDQAASVEPLGLYRLVKYIRAVEAALGDGEKKVYESEQPGLKRLRRVDTLR